MTNWSPDSFPRGGGQITLSLDGDRATLLLDQPARKNAISPGMMRDLRDAVKVLEAQMGISSLLLTGAGDAFCTGGDLSAVREHLMAPEAGAGMCAMMTDVTDRLSALPVVIVAAVEGHAIGGGAELLTVADVVIAARSARIGFIHARLGVSPGWGGGRRLVERIGARDALKAMAFARTLSAEAAQSLGLVDELVEDGEARAHAAGLQHRLSSLPVQAVRAAVAIARGQPEGPLFARLWGGPAHLHALSTVNAGR
ncbi:MAG: enoyl-CoA hydratase/isomerase family protein [Myxococcota bacterium]